MIRIIEKCERGSGKQNGFAATKHQTLNKLGVWNVICSWCPFQNKDPLDDVMANMGIP